MTLPSARTRASRPCADAGSAVIQAMTASSMIFSGAFIELLRREAQQVFVAEFGVGRIARDLLATARPHLVEPGRGHERGNTLRIRHRRRRATIFTRSEERR